MAEFFATHFAFITTPEGWAALVALVAMEVVLGIDNLIFISILTNKLPPEHQRRARRIGIGVALILRLVLLGTIAFIVGLTEPVFTVFGHGFSWRDLILIAGGLFLVWKATKEIHHNVDPQTTRTDVFETHESTSRLRRRRSARSCCSTWCSRSTASSPRSA